MLLVDGRAGSKGLIPLFPPDICKKTTLESADVAFFGHGPEGPFTLPIGIEYKTAKEALQCLHDGRLTGEQLPKMSQSYKRVYILIEGEYKEDSNGLIQFKSWKDSKPIWASFSSTTYRAFDNWLNSIAEIGHIIIKRSVDRAESAAMILNLYHMWGKDYDKHSSLFKFDKSQEPTLLHKPSVKRLIAASIPGIGHELSGRVAAHFPNVVEMINATEESWEAIHGIGKIKAQKIYSALRTN
jgi:ERCC4-type nuclease